MERPAESPGSSPLFLSKIGTDTTNTLHWKARGPVSKHIAVVDSAKPSGTPPTLTTISEILQDPASVSQAIEHLCTTINMYILKVCVYMVASFRPKPSGHVQYLELKHYKENSRTQEVLKMSSCVPEGRTAKAKKPSFFCELMLVITHADTPATWHLCTGPFWSLLHMRL